MSKSTSIDVCWTAGTELTPLLGGLEAFASRHNLLLMPPGGQKPGRVPPWGAKPYSIHYSKGKRIETIETDEPAELEPLKDPDFRGIYWELYTTEGYIWFVHSIIRESVVAMRARRLFIGVDEYFADPFFMNNEEIKTAKAKYYQVRELLSALDADAVEGWDGQTGAPVFRFAKDGSQVTIREELLNRDSGWEFVGETRYRQWFGIGGLDVWKHYWKNTRLRALVKDPHSQQELTFEVSEIRHGDNVVRFAAGTLSNGMWGFYVRK